MIHQEGVADMGMFSIPADAEEQFEERGYFVVRKILTDRAVMGRRVRILDRFANKVRFITGRGLCAKL